MTEELTEDETTDLRESGLAVRIPGLEEEEGEEGEGEPTEGEAGQNPGGAGAEAQDPEELDIQGGEEEPPEELTEEQKEWREKISQYETDPETGFLIEPETGVLIDPATGQSIDGSSFMD